MAEKPTYEDLEKRVRELEQDHSELQKAEKALQESEERYRLHFENITDVVYAIDREFVVIDVSPSVEKALGYKPAELIGQPFQDINILNADHIEKAIQDSIRVFNGERISSTEYQFIHRNGEKRWGEVSGAPLIVDNQITGLISVARDITERKRMEEELTFERDFSNRIMETSLAGITHVDADGNVIYANNRAEEILGFQIASDGVRKYNAPAWKITQFDGEPFPNDRLPFVIVKKTLRPVFDIRHAIKWPDGKTIFLSVNAAPMLSASGEFEGMVANIDDITDRVRAREALKRSEERFSSMFEHMGSGVAVYETMDGGNDFIFRAFNPAAENITRLSAEQVLGKRLLELFPHMDKAGLLGSLQRVWKTGKSEHIPPFYYEDKTRKGWRENRIYKLPSGEVVALFNDVTDRMNAENALRESEQKYREMSQLIRRMCDNVPDMIWAKDLEKRYIFANKAICDNLLVASDTLEPIGKTDMFFAQRERQAHPSNTNWHTFGEICRDSDAITIETEVPGQFDEYGNVKGKFLYLSVHKAPFYDENGELIGTVGSARDVTKTKQLEEQLRQSHKMEAIGTLAGGIAHDFNNILYIIAGNAEMAMDDIPESHPAHDNLSEIKSASFKAAGIVKQLLHFSRKSDHQLKPIGAVAIINDALKLLRSTIPMTIEIRKNIPNTETTILGDPTQISQVVMNLFINASQAMETTGGILDIAIENITLDKSAAKRYADLKPGEYIKIAVSDTGPGIAPDILGKIFDPYFTTKDFGKGSGMGLTVVHGIVKNHNGIVTVGSLPGKGTTFTIFLPAVLGKPLPAGALPDTIPRGAGERILFIDDEEAVAKMCEQRLQRLGYAVETHTTPTEALELFISQPDYFDIVVTDMTMPKMTGIQLFEKIKEVRPDIPVIICTGHSELIDEERAKQSGIACYVMKPIETKTIAKTIRDVLDKK